MTVQDGGKIIMSEEQVPYNTGKKEKKAKMYTYYITYNYRNETGNIGNGYTALRYSNKIEYMSDINEITEGLIESKKLKNVVLTSWNLLKDIDRP